MIIDSPEDMKQIKRLLSHFINIADSLIDGGLINVQELVEHERKNIAIAKMYIDRLSE